MISTLITVNYINEGAKNDHNIRSYTVGLKAECRKRVKGRGQGRGMKGREMGRRQGEKQV